MRIKDLSGLRSAEADGALASVTDISIDGADVRPVVDRLAALSGAALPGLERLVLVRGGLDRLPSNLGEFTALTALVVWGASVMTSANWPRI